MITAIVSSVVYAIFVGFLLRRAVSTKLRFASWHMFTCFSHCRFKLYENGATFSERPFDIWQYVPHTMLSVDEKAAGAILYYLREVRKLDLFGTLLIESAGHLREVRVEGTRVVG